MMQNADAKKGNTLNQKQNSNCCKTQETAVWLKKKKNSLSKSKGKWGEEGEKKGDISVNGQ